MMSTLYPFLPQFVEIFHTIFNYKSELSPHQKQKSNNTDLLHKNNLFLLLNKTPQSPKCKSFQSPYYVHESQQSSVFKSNSTYFESAKMLLSSSDSLGAYACAMSVYWIKCIECLTCIKYY